MNCPILSTQKSHYDSFQVSTSIYNIFYYFYYFSSVLINLYTILLIRYLSFYSILFWKKIKSTMR